MKFKLDENLGHGAAEVLRLAGHDVATVVEQSICSSPDSELIDVCRREERCLVTMDVEFGNPFMFKPSQYSGIALLRLPHKLGPNDIETAIRTLLGGLEKDQIVGKLWVIQLGRIRVYQEDWYEPPGQE